MNLRRISRVLVLFCLVLSTFCSRAESGGSSSRVFVRFLQVPPALSNQTSATFVFQVAGGSGEKDCSNCSFSCKLDERITPNCGDRNASFSGLQDGQHTFMVCVNASTGASCSSSYNWTVDTVPPTAYITAATAFTSAVNVSVNISFSEPCTFGCLTVNTCNLIVYGDGQVMPQTLRILEPNLKYSMIIALSSSIQYGRAILLMYRGFCSDAAGNKFIRTENSTFTIHFDRRRVLVNLTTHVPEKLVQLDGQTRTVQATNNHSKLKVYVYFSHPVLNTSEEILSSLHVSHGSLQPIQGKSLASRRFRYLIKGIPNVAIVTINLNSDMIISRQGTQVSPVAPATLLYDTERPAVMLSTTSKMRTKEKSIAVSIRFTKPVFNFDSTHISISGGHLQSFHELSRNYYAVYVQATEDIIYISVPDNVTSDIAGNENLPSNVLQVRHYSVPVLSIILGNFVTASFLATCLLAGLLTVSTASLQSTGAFTRSLPSLTSDPTRNLFRIACYIQVFALSRWLAVTLPTEYYEFTACLKWSIPYLNLPWENEHDHLPIFGPTPPSSELFSAPKDNILSIPKLESRRESIGKANVVYGAPLTPIEYGSFLESQNNAPQAEYVPDLKYLDGWMDFKRSMFWLAVIGGSLIVLHGLLLLILKLRGSSSEKRRYGALVFPRFEIFLLILSVPCICKSSVSIIKGGTHLGTIIGVLLLLLASFLQLALLVFLSFGITLGKLLQYKEVHQVGQKFHWYQELVRVTLGPGKRGQWTWKDQPNSINLTNLGPLFEDLRGPPKYMLSQFSTSSTLRRGDRIIASDDETEDAEAPFIQKLFGILRIYYTLLESLKRFALGIASGLVFFSGTAHPSKAPTLALLSITSFQLFFLVLKKPFIKKKVQLVEIISIACEVGMFATFMGLLNRDFWTQNEHKSGFFMIALFLIGYLALLINECYALYKQMRQLDTEENAFGTGLKRASAGLLLFCFPQKLIRKLDKRLLENANCTPPAEACRSSESISRSSSGVDRAWIKQIREMARAGFAREGRGSENEGSTSNSRWSRFWNRNRSGSSSMGSSNDYKSKSKSKSKSKGLHKDLEAIFAASTSDQAGTKGSERS